MLDMYSFAYYSGSSVAPGGVLSVDGEVWGWRVRIAASTV